MKRIPKRKTLSHPSVRTFGYPPSKKNIPKVFKKSNIGGKKPKGWEKRKSRYRISFKAEYEIRVYDRSWKKYGKRRYITISNAYFKGADKRDGIDLEDETLRRMNDRIEIWKQKDISDLESKYPSRKGYEIHYIRKGSDFRVYRL